MTEPLTSKPMRELKSRLIRLAADMVRGSFIPREFDVDAAYKTTPKAERNRIAGGVLKLIDEGKRIGVALRQIADALPADEASKCPVCGIPLPLKPGNSHWSECPNAEKT